MGIGETLRRALATLIMGAAGDQAKIVCGNLQLCAGLEAGIEGDTHDVGKRRLERVKEILNGENKDGDLDEEEENWGVAAMVGNLSIDTAGTEEEAAENLQEALEMETEKEGGNVAEGVEGGASSLG